MKMFDKSAVPLHSVSMEDPWLRPDMKPCRSQFTDRNMITLTWTSTRGTRMATFYDGCDQEELEDFYKSVLAVTDPLPIQDIIREP